jgi:hypothetical protein
LVATTQASPPGRQAPAWLDIGRHRALAPLLVAALLVLLALISTGGVLSGPPDGHSGTQIANSWIDVVLILAGGCTAAGLVIRRREGGGSVSFGLFAAVTVLTALSIAWSVAPDQSWEESGREVAYLAGFGIAVVCGRLGRERMSSRGALLAITLAAQTLCIWALAVKVFDLNLYGQPAYGPLLAPFAYWNATGVIGAMALPGCVYLAAGRENPRLLRGVAVAGIAVAATVVVLTYSRSAVAAAALGTLVPVCLIRERRRAVLMLALGLLGGVPVWIFAASNHNVSADTGDSLYGLTSTAPIGRVGAGLILGALLLAVLVILTVAGTALSGYLDASPQPARRLALYDRGLVGLVALVPVAILLWLVFNHRGLTGEISHLWQTLTETYGADAGGTASRLGNLANSRALYWREALAVGDHHLLGGAGAGTFYPAYLGYHQALLGVTGQAVTHAHSYVLEAYATLGILGVLLNLGLFCSWWRDAIGSVRRRAAVAVTELGARWGLIGVVIAFGVSSALDWTWFFPGVAIPGLVAAGWIAGVSGPRRSTDAPLVAAGPARPAATPPAPGSPRPLAARPGAIIALTLLCVVTLAVAWESLAPMRSTQSRLASLSAQAAQNGRAALGDARAAISQDPLSALALERLAAIYGASGQPAAERAELIKATQVQPDNPQPFATLGSYLLCSRHLDAAAVSPLRRANRLDLTDFYLQTQLLAAARTGRYPARACSAST